MHGPGRRGNIAEPGVAGKAPAGSGKNRHRHGHFPAVFYGAALAIDKPAPDGGHVQVARSGGAVSVQWKDSWTSALRFDTAGVDLRPYMKQGVVALDLKVKDLAKGGLTFKL